MYRIALAALVPALAACSSEGTNPPPPTPCTVGFLGVKNAPLDFEIHALTAGGSDVALKDGDDLALVFPPQGGRVVFLGVRATNVDGCAVVLQGVVRDTTTQLATIDRRTVDLETTGDGWGVSGHGTAGFSSAISSYANVPLCPNQWASTDAFDHEFQIEVSLQDKTGSKLTRTVKATPRCAEPARSTECLCICRHGYVLGSSCVADAGPG